MYSITCILSNTYMSQQVFGVEVASYPEEEDMTT